LSRRGNPSRSPSSDPNFPFLKLSTQIPSEGEDIVVVGNPLGLESSVSTGIVSAVRNIPAFGNIVHTTQFFLVDPNATLAYNPSIN
jgi:S1-C subfamily serine protease